MNKTEQQISTAEKNLLKLIHAQIEQDQLDNLTDESTDEEDEAEMYAFLYPPKKRKPK